jgi:hypothetical protein
MDTAFGKVTLNTPSFAVLTLERRERHSGIVPNSRMQPSNGESLDLVQSENGS